MKGWLDWWQRATLWLECTSTLHPPNPPNPHQSQQAHALIDVLHAQFNSLTENIRAGKGVKDLTLIKAMQSGRCPPRAPTKNNLQEEDKKIVNMQNIDMGTESIASMYNVL